MSNLKYSGIGKAFNQPSISIAKAFSALSLAKVRYELRGEEYADVWAEKAEYALLALLVRDSGYHVVDQRFDLISRKHVYTIWLT